MGGVVEGDCAAHRARGAPVQPGNGPGILHAFRSSCCIILYRRSECGSGSREGRDRGRYRRAANRELIIALATSSGVPAIYPRPVFAESGGLIAYGADLAELFRQAAGYIDRILKGANAGDLPVQRPTKFELVINLQAAKSIGIEVPPMLLARADKVIE